MSNTGCGFCGGAGCGYCNEESRQQSSVEIRTIRARLIGPIEGEE